MLPDKQTIPGIRFGVTYSTRVIVIVPFSIIPFSIFDGLPSPVFFNP